MRSHGKAGMSVVVVVVVMAVALVMVVVVVVVVAVVRRVLWERGKLRWMWEGPEGWKLLLYGGE